MESYFQNRKELRCCPAKPRQWSNIFFVGWTVLGDRIFSMRESRVLPREISNVTEKGIVGRVSLGGTVELDRGGRRK